MDEYWVLVSFSNDVLCYEYIGRFSLIVENVKMFFLAQYNIKIILVLKIYLILVKHN